MIELPDPLPTLAPSPRDAPQRVVLIEDDPGDQVLFEVSLEQADPQLQVVAVDGFEGFESLPARDGAACVVLDLGLPGFTGFEALDRLLALEPAIAVVVLTGWGDQDAGIAAVARGAQDYLVKGEADGATIARSIRFAVERKRSQLAAAALAEAEVRQAEQHRLERALLAEPVLRRADLSLTSRYQAARPGVVSGDFFDAIELDDGTVRLVVGDVAGHGADEAALGVALRAGWRSLVLAGLDPTDLLVALEELIAAERRNGDEFATVCDLTIAPDLTSVCVRSAGHPPPVLAGRGALVDTARRAPLGVRLGPRDLPGTRHDLPARWSLVAYTDGLFEVRSGDGVLAAEAVPPAVEAASGHEGVDADALIAAFAGLDVEGWRDDVAVIVISGWPAP
ncbi:MAG TPA: SpoIIE family protein phosphatase [Aquihabitans sp.]|mgnify:CR=1 FL=1|nr:SpoIIE family protein phosphatase [Aquihabitans sp.]